MHLAESGINKISRQDDSPARVENAAILAVMNIFILKPKRNATEKGDKSKY
jgi:hypothetical protein